MTDLEASYSIKKQADSLIEKKGLNHFFSSFGEVIYTGSYAVDLMTWRDIDLQIKLSDNQDKLKIIGSIFNHMVEDQDVIHIEYTDSSKKRNSKMPEGQYLQFRIQDGESIWKIDLWILNEFDFNENRNLMNKLEEMLSKNKALRDLIIKMKFDIMGENHRPPKMASYYLYQAILFENISDPEQIKDYIRSYGIKI